MKRTLFSALFVSAWIFIGSAHAHHSFPASYNVDEEITIRGVLISFSYRNPHSTVQFNATDEEGNTERWLIEWGAANSLANSGVTKTTLRPGDEMILTGSPPRDKNAKRLRLQSLERISDGWKWPKNPGDADYN
jgi:hypothetical protein